jgi:lipopolysaccharide/colanic/teichoic acid biosynthesis glycosyltransferase
VGKRLFDLCIAVPALACLGPLMLLIAAWVRLDSPGPALFRQARVGRHGRQFEVLKFRTMRVATGDGPQITVGADARITRAGRFLREWKLDELPQFINVLAGQMSIVGPRPEVPRYVALYPPDVRHAVLGVRPGITDLASIAYRDESRLLAQSADPERTYVEDILPRKLQFCLEYLAHQGLGQDLRIVLATVVALFRSHRT